MTAGRRRLGRGLEALLGPTTVAYARREGTLREFPLDIIRPNPYQPRHAIEEAALDELAESMRTAGLLQPVVVRPAGEGAYQLIAGERRWRAAQRLGWNTIPVVVREVDDRTLLTLALVENLQRDALSPIDEARGYARLIQDFGTSQDEVGKLVGRDRSTVANALRLLRLPEGVQRLVHQGMLTAGHARALLALGTGREIEQLAMVAVAKRLSVREVEELVRDGRTGKGRRRRAPAPPDPQVRRVEEALRQRLQTDVRVAPRGKNSGKVTIQFYSNDDLARILEVILGEPFEG